MMKEIMGNWYKELLKVFLSTLVGFMVMGCSKDEVKNDPDPLVREGSLEELKKIYTDAFVEAMIALDFNTNLGSTPPNIEGSFLISPAVLSESTVDADSALLGSPLPNYKLIFSNQDNNNLLIDYKGYQDEEVDDGGGSFVTGNNGAFAVYAKTITQIQSSTAQTAIAISGVLAPDGIKNIQFFGAMLNDNGDPQNIFIGNNTGRVLIDDDGLSVRTN